MNKKQKYILAVSILILVAVLSVGIYLILPKNSTMTASVIYTDAGFNPSSIAVEINTVITFKNNSSKPFQPVPDRIDPRIAKNPCIDDISKGNLDGACEPISPGGTWSATFDFSGGFHDALKSSSTINIVVTPLSGQGVGIPLNDVIKS